MAKKSKQVNKKPLSEKDYVKKFARTFPVEMCEMTYAPTNPHTVRVLVVRKEPTGLYTVGFYLIDSWCRGLYDTYCRAHITQEQLDDVLNMDKENRIITPMTYDEAHNYIFGAIEYGQEAGFDEPKEFKESQYVLAEDTDDIPLISYDFGIDGKRVLECSTIEQFNRAKNILERNLTPDQYELIGATGDDYYDYDEDEDFNDDYDYFDLDEEACKSLKKKFSPKYHKFIDLLQVNGDKFYDLDEKRQIIVSTAVGMLYDVVAEQDNLVDIPKISQFMDAFKKFQQSTGDEVEEDTDVENCVEDYFDLSFDLLVDTVDFTRKASIKGLVSTIESDEQEAILSFFLLAATIYINVKKEKNVNVKKMVDVENNDSTLLLDFLKKCIKAFDSVF